MHLRASKFIISKQQNIKALIIYKYTISLEFKKSRTFLHKRCGVPGLEPRPLCPHLIGNHAL